MNEEDEALAAEVDQTNARDEKRRLRGSLFLLFGGVGLAALFLVLLVGWSQTRVSQADEQKSATVTERNTTVGQQADDIQKLEENQRRIIDLLEEANRDRAAKGEPTIPIPPPVTAGPPPPPIPGAVDPRNGKDGQDGRDGRDGLPGKPGSPGPSGKPGRDGSPGASGQPGATVTGPNGQDGIPGSDGSPGQDGLPGKDGAPGADGKDGKDGAPGRGIASARCVDGRWEITYTDDTTNDGGSCMPQPGPTTTATVTVTPEPTEEETQ